MAKASALLVLAFAVVFARSAVASCYDRDASGRPVRFQLRGGEAFDTRTGLTWRRCSAGTSWNDRRGCEGETAYVGLDDAMRIAASLGGGWRVPSGPELESLIDFDCGRPVVDTTVFPDVRPTEEGMAKYWTTNPVGVIDLYYNFDLIDGHADGNTRGMQLAVKFVRAK